MVVIQTTTDHISSTEERVDSHGKEIEMTPETKKSQLSSGVTGRPSRLRGLKAALVATALTFAAGGVLFNVDAGQHFGANAAAATSERAAPPAAPPSVPGFSFADLVQKVSPAVVS